METLFTAEEISKTTGWHLMTVYAKARRGEIPGVVRLGSRSLRFRASVIEEWIESGAIKVKTDELNHGEAS